MKVKGSIFSLVVFASSTFSSFGESSEVWYNHKGEVVKGELAPEPKKLDLPFFEGHEELKQEGIANELLTRPKKEKSPQTVADIPYLQPITGDKVKNERRRRNYFRSYHPYSYRLHYGRSNRPYQYRRRSSGLSFSYNRSGSRGRWGIQYRSPGLRKHRGW